MNIVHCNQGSQEWLNARCGLITASMFKECRKRLKSGPNKGDFSSEAKQYAFRLACERISGELLTEDKFETWEMRRGHELEPTARLLHEEREGILVEQVGFAVSDCGIYGASVDGAIDDDGISEYKCFVAPKSIMPIVLDHDISDTMDQIQGGLWVTKKKWAHFCLYCPALKKVGKELTVIPVERNQNYIDEMIPDLAEFDGLVEKYIGKLTEKAA